MTQPKINAAGIDAWAGSPDAQRVLDALGEQMVADARANAPRKSGAGAASIHHVVAVDDEGAYVRVSWDEDHDYLRFSELGTSEMPARPFLRPAASKRRNL